MIETQNLTKRYGRQMVVNHLNFSVRSGTVFGVVGENGAGKTTTLSMLVTLTTPTSGRAYVDGYEVMANPREVRRSVGYMPDSFGVYDDIRCDEYLKFYADCYGVSRWVAEQRATEYLEWVGLHNKRQAYVNTLSRGMQQRLEIARCMMHDPPVLVLDEPASGLDPRSRLDLRTVIRGLKERGKTVMLSSHILNELVEVADEIGIMRNGEMAAVATVDVLKNHTTAYRTLRIIGRGASGLWEKVFGHHSAVTDVRSVHDGYEVDYAGTVYQQAELLTELVSAGVSVREFTEHAMNVEDLFLRLTDSLSDTATDVERGKRR